MRKHFDQSSAIDAASNARLVAVFENHDDPYTGAEEKILRAGLSAFVAVMASNAKDLSMASPSTTAKVAYETGSSYAMGMATTTVRASPAAVLAFRWDAINSRASRQADDLERSVDEEPNGHNKLVYVHKKTPKAIDDRDFLGRALWRATDDGFVNVTNVEESVRRPHLDGVVRGAFPSAMKITADGDSTKIQFVIQPDYGGIVPGWAMKFYLRSNLSTATQIRLHFQAVRGLSQWDERDGEATADFLLVRTESEKHHRRGETRVEARIREAFVKHKGLRELGGKDDWFQVLLAKIVGNKLRPAGDSSVKLCNMTKKQAAVIGGALASCIMANLTAHAAVDEWVLRYPAMGELDREYVLVSPRARAKRAKNR
jgi:hypothetical protein